jgi:HlyD family secretion protein
MTGRQIGLRLAVLAVIVASVGAGSYKFLAVSASAPGVSTAVVSRGDIVASISASGTLEAVTTVLVGSQVSGVVKALFADFNDIVQKGEVLARLDPSAFEAQLEQARANLVRAEADAERQRVVLEDARIKLARTTRLAARQLVAPTELEAAEISVRSADAQVRSADAQVTQARASVNQAQVNLDHTVITAPIDGIVIARNVDVGQTVAASMQTPTLFILAADLSRMRVNAKIDESDIARIREGLPVTFRVDAYPAETFVGTVAQVRLQPEVVQNVVTYLTVVDVSNAELKLKPGMTANVTVETARRENVLRVASAATRFRPTAEALAALGVPAASAAAASKGGRAANGQSVTAVVWRVVGKSMEPVVVETGLSDGTTTEVKGGGVNAEDVLVTAVNAGSTGSARTTTSSKTTSNPLMGPSMPPPPPGGPR